MPRAIARTSDPSKKQTAVLLVMPRSFRNRDVDGYDFAIAGFEGLGTERRRPQCTSSTDATDGVC